MPPASSPAPRTCRRSSERLTTALTSCPRARYPTSPWAPEARAWHAALSELLKHEADAAQTRGDLERLKELDKELEER